MPVSIAPRADVEAPSFTGTGSLDARDVRLTMRDVVLMHVEDGLSALDEDQDVYDVNLQVPLLGRTIDFDRGYQWVDVRAGAKRFRFVNTHLEAFSSDIAFAQAAAAARRGVAEDRTTIFVCDCNSDPLNSRIKAGNDTAAAQGGVRADHRRRRLPRRERLHRRVAGVGAGRGGLDVRPVRDGGRRDGDGLRPPHRHDVRPHRRR